METKGEPLRSCVVCRKIEKKTDLLRFVFSSQLLDFESNLASVIGEVFVDFAQIASGRGFYVHASRSCLVSKRTSGSILRALEKLAQKKGAKAEFKDLGTAVLRGEKFLNFLKGNRARKILSTQTKIGMIKNILEETTDGNIPRSAGKKVNFGFRS